MSQSVFTRLWNAVKPPPAVAKKRLSARARRVLWSSCGLLAAGGAAWAVQSYVASAPQRAEQEFEAGMRLMAPGNYPGAIGHFNRALRISPGLAGAYYERGIAHRMTNQNDQALDDFKRALQINGTLAPAYSALGSLYRDRRDFQHAMEQYTKLLEIQPSGGALYERGQTYELLGQHQKAIDDYNRAIETMGEAPALFRARALARRNLGTEAGWAADGHDASSMDHR